MLPRCFHFYSSGSRKKPAGEVKGQYRFRLQPNFRGLKLPLSFCICGKGGKRKIPVPRVGATGGWTEFSLRTIFDLLPADSRVASLTPHLTQTTADGSVSAAQF